MGPDEDALDLADHLIAKLGLTVDRIELGYAIMGWAEEQPVLSDDY